MKIKFETKKPQPTEEDKLAAVLAKKFKELGCYDYRAMTDERLAKASEDKKSLHPV